MHDLAPTLLVSALIVYPAWRIFSRAGLNPALSLFVFVPGLGVIITAYILALSRWPKIDAKE